MMDKAKDELTVLRASNNQIFSAINVGINSQDRRGEANNSFAQQRESEKNKSIARLIWLWKEKFKRFVFVWKVVQAHVAA